MLWRADDPTISPRTELQTLAGQGLAAMLDLRSTPEASASPHRTAAELGIAHHHLPLAESAVHPLALVRAAPSMQSPADVGRWYAGLVRNHLQEVVRALRIIGTADGGVLFHCAAGKDRTGILAAVVLALLGAGRNVIVEDYAATEQNMYAVIPGCARPHMRRPPTPLQTAPLRTAESKRCPISSPATIRCSAQSRTPWILCSPIWAENRA